MSVVYNEIEPFAADWIERLANAGHVASGTVDRRSIRDVRPEDVAATQAHFFAGLGGWSYALRIAGWPDDAPVWTGSCPCQPFSAAGRKGGFSDERHLWPIWFDLIRERRPSVIFGEQVASPDGLRWLDLVSSDLEGEGYSVGAADLCAAGVGAPHLRQRLYFVAYSDRQRPSRIDSCLRPEDDGRLAPKALLEAPGRGETSDLADASRPGLEKQFGEPGVSRAATDGDARKASKRDGATFWTPSDWVACSDGKSRPVEPGSFPLAYGIPGRVGRLRAYGNAIVPQVAATFVRAFMESTKWIADV